MGNWPSVRSFTQDELSRTAVLQSVEGYRKPGTDHWYAVGTYQALPLLDPVYVTAAYDENGHGSSGFVTGDAIAKMKLYLTEYTEPFTAEELRERRKMFESPNKK